MEINLLSRVITPDGTELISASRHDYRSHEDSNGETYFIDGGLDYVKTSVNKEPAVYKPVVLSIDEYEKVRQEYKRLTYDGRVVKVSEMSDEHLKNTIIYNAENGFAGSQHTLVYVLELMYRKQNGITIQEEDAED